MQTEYYAPNQTNVIINDNEGSEQFVGSYRDTVLFRVGEKRFVPFMCTVINIDPYDHREMVAQINKFKKCCNVCIEDDARLMILIAIEILGYNFLIYSSSSRLCFNVYEYVAKTYEIFPYTLNLHQITHLIRAHVLFSTSFRNSQLQWNLKIMLETIIDSGHELFYTNIRKYFDKLTNRSMYTVNKLMFDKLAKYVNRYFSQPLSKCNEEYIAFELEHVTSNDLYQVIIYLTST